MSLKVVESSKKNGLRLNKFRDRKSKKYYSMHSAPVGCFPFRKKMTKQDMAFTKTNLAWSNLMVGKIS